MFVSYKPDDTEIMQAARKSLIRRKGEGGLATQFNVRVRLLPQGPDRSQEERRTRSLQTCHRYSLYERPRAEPPSDTGAYIPELSARLENDQNLTDGARRCARKIAEETYRRNREGRSLEVTVTYLMKALGRCRRTIQRYLGLLEREGYIYAEVAYGTRSKMCVGLIVHLLKPLFARHHAKEWPKKLKKPGATKESHKYSFNLNNKDNFSIITRNEWALKCMDGVFGSLMKTLPLFELDISPTN